MILLVSLTTTKAIDCEVLTTVGKDHKHMIFFPQKSENFKQIKSCSTFDCSLDDAEILRTHRQVDILNQYPIQHAFLVVGCTRRF